MNNKKTIFILITILLFYFFYLAFIQSEIILTKRRFTETNNQLKNEINQTIHLNNTLTIYKEKYSSSTNNETDLYLFSKKYNNIKINGFLPNKNNYKISASGDYFELINFTQTIRKQFQLSIENLSLSLPNEQCDFELKLELNALPLEEDGISSPPPQNNSFAHLSMVGYLEYGHERWCLLSEKNHTLSLLKEGGQIEQGIIQSIQTDHISIISQNKNYLIPLENKK
ncbi:MAG: hypothetical protein HY939_05185 [Gammaproteobacteria bacterium]|nr:hypothetical protein [Gammaproteobacteria bacterium]